jgi:ELWxxDGT repeat protein
VRSPCFNINTVLDIQTILSLYHNKQLMRQIYMAVLFFFAATTAFCQNPLLLKDVYPGATGSSIQQIVKTSNYTFFNAEDEDADADRGLYRTDGTMGGTIKLNLSYLPDPPPSVNNYASTKAEKLTALGDKVIFAGDNLAPGYGEIWASDGTQAGTIALERFQPTLTNRGPVYELAAMNGYVYYGVVASNNKTQIRRTNGTAAGTSLLYEFSSYTTAPEPGLFKVINGILYFNIYDRRGAGNDMVWRTDGTTAGTYQLRDMGADYFLMGFFMEPVNGATCFMTGKVDPVNFASSKTTLFKTDGTPAGTVPVYDFNGVYNNNLYPSYAVIGNTVYFSAYDNVNGKELWKTDGTTAGTMLVTDIVPGAGSSSPLNLKNFNGQLYFSANISGTYKFYKLEGNTAVMVKDISPLNGINGNSSFAISNNSLVFTAGSAPAALNSGYLMEQLLILSSWRILTPE